MSAYTVVPLCVLMSICALMSYNLGGWAGCSFMCITSVVFVSLAGEPE